MSLSEGRCDESVMWASRAHLCIANGALVYTMEAFSCIYSD